MRPSRGGRKSRKTKELPVVEFALILWLFFIFILVVIQSSQKHQPRFIDAEASGEKARHDDRYPQQRISSCLPLLKLIAILERIVKESVDPSPHNVTGTEITVLNPASLKKGGREGAFLFG